MYVVVDYSRCEITHPDGTIPRARFVFRDGNAAVWVEDKKTRTARRVYLSSNSVFTPSTGGKLVHTLTTPDSTWTITQIQGGCGCGSVLKAHSIDDLLSSDFSEISQRPKTRTHR